LAASMEHPVANFHADLTLSQRKTPGVARRRAPNYR
jgi:hypothetical protein